MQKSFILPILRACCQGWEEEYRFDAVRKWRFDFALPSRMLAIEYEGVFSEKSRHTTPLGYTEDCRKYNNAVLHGWTVLRYTAKNISLMQEEVRLFLNKK